MSKIKIIILAAGKGTRMHSSLPKVLHQIANKPMLQHVLDTANSLHQSESIIVFGHGGDSVKQKIEHDGIWVEQSEQKGTGHAVLQAMPYIQDEDTVLILYGDVPLLQSKTLVSVADAAQQGKVSLLAIELENPTGYGRVICDATGAVQRIVEQKDATQAELASKLINTGILAAPGGLLRNWLQQLQPNNAQGEYYLTDIFAMAVHDNVPIVTELAADVHDVSGVNNKSQLAELERAFQLRQAEQLMTDGVTLLDPTRFDLRGRVTALGEDIVIDCNVILQGVVALGNNVSIGANSVIINSQIGDNVVIEPNCVIEDAVIGKDCQIGPFARVRPGSNLIENVKIGNFVETKNVEIAKGSKVNHLSYIGDATIGAGVNIGAGTITCNYDGANKYRTVIKDGAFIGSDTQLVAPVVIGENATIGAGSTITADTPENQLTLSRGKQFSIAHWKRPVKIKK